MNVVIDKTKGITAYSSLQRLFTEQQRLVLAAIDGGCTFPQCPMPPGWCQIDHTIDHHHGGPTNVGNGGLGLRLRQPRTQRTRLETRPHQRPRRLDSPTVD
jgi:hypothetical protein